MPGVKLTKLIEKMHLKNLTPEVPVEGKYITVPQINRPALQLTGYFEEFDYIRVQIIGIVENNYLQTLTKERKKAIYQKLLEYEIPCIIYTTDLEPEEELLRGAIKAGIPVLSTNKKTSPFQAEVIRWLNVQLAPCISIHGVLVDVYGVGVLIRGESGIGKSELALELIKRGHRLVTDDAVEIRKVSDETLVGNAPSITKHLIELRGIGIIDIKSLYGVQSVKETQNIDLVITLEEWEKGSIGFCCFEITENVGKIRNGFFHAFLERGGFVNAVMVLNTDEVPFGSFKIFLPCKTIFHRHIVAYGFSCRDEISGFRIYVRYKSMYVVGVAVTFYFFHGKIMD